MTCNAVVVRFAEVFLKGGRKAWFIARMKEALERNVRQAGSYRVREDHDHLLVLNREASGASLPDIDVTPELEEALARSFGIQNYSPCRLVPREIGVIETEVMKIADEHVAGAASFRIEASRADKEYPLSSMDLARRLGGQVWIKHQVPGRMKDPAVSIGVRIMSRVAMLSVRTVKGPGGLPVGTAGRVLLLLSGGIDSPVAGWQMLRRGCDVDAVHFEAAPYTKAQARAKVETLAGMLAAYQASMRLWVVPFASVQAELRDRAPGRMLVVLYRRMMVRIATRLAQNAGALALVTGENLGQVASQTLENMSVIEEAAGLPVLRPLLAFDKLDTIVIAKQIKTYRTSVLPYEDCCSLFVPPHPETAARLEPTRAIEERFDIEAMINDADAATEEIQIGVDPVKKVSQSSAPEIHAAQVLDPENETETEKEAATETVG
jgi:thiamine biosynthesis protein ThiI